MVPSGAITRPSAVEMASRLGRAVPQPALLLAARAGVAASRARTGSEAERTSNGAKDRRRGAVFKDRRRGAVFIVGLARAERGTHGTPGAVARTRYFPRRRSALRWQLQGRRAAAILHG